MTQLRRLAALCFMLGLAGLAAIGVVALIRVFVRRPVTSAEVTGAIAAAGLLVGFLAARIRPRVPRRVVLELDLAQMPREPGPRTPASVLGRQPLDLAETVAALNRGAGDRRVRALVVRPRFSGSVPPAAVQELRDAITAFAQAGKPTVAVADSFGEVMSLAPYYLASACAEVVVHPSGEVALSAPAMEPNFYAGLLERAGVRLEVLARREYKSFANQLTHERLTDPDREQYQALLDSVWAQVVSDISTARGIDPDQLRHLADQSPLTPAEAQSAGLIDRVAYTDDVIDGVKAAAGGARLLFLSVYKKRAGRGRQGKTVPVALVRVNGAIMRSAEAPITPTGGPTVAADRLIGVIRAAGKDKKTKALVLRVESPGGSSVASDTIWRELTKVDKPVVVSMGSVAASGGYYIAAPAQRIVAQPSTITGSIGVVAMHFVLNEAKAKLDIRPDLVKTGAEPPLISVNRPYSDAQRQRMDTMIDKIYAEFIERVAEGRHLSLEKVDSIGRGRVWSGADAKAIGLVDELGGLERALEVAAELAGHPDRRAAPRVFPRQRGPRAVLARNKSDSSDEVSSEAGLAGLIDAGGWGAAFNGLFGQSPLVHLGLDPRSFWIR
jgi:protease-4